MSEDNQEFDVGGCVISQFHGVGRIDGISEKEIYGGKKIKFYVVHAKRHGITLEIPVCSANEMMRAPVTREEFANIELILQGKSKNTFSFTTSRKSQDLEAGIKSLDLSVIASILRTLFRASSSARSYSEYFVYEAAMYLVSSEAAHVFDVSDGDAEKGIMMILNGVTSTICESA